MSGVRGPGAAGREIWEPLPESAEGPALATVTARLRVTPAEVTARWVVLEALLHDALELVDPRPLEAQLADLLAANPEPDRQPRWTELDPAARAGAAVTCWLIGDPELAGTLRASAGDDVRRVATTVVARMAAYVAVLPFAAWLRPDEDRQEEIARAVLRAAGLRPRGESVAQSEDRWTSISTRSRAEALRHAAERAAWEEQVARRLAEQKAREAAAQYTHV